MGKIILEFDSQEEANEARTALDGYKWQHAMWELDQKLRQTTKYGVSVIHSESEAPEFEQDIAEKYREMIRDILNNSNLKLD
jgi:DNA-binding IclR family transcriptional regulator